MRWQSGQSWPTPSEQAVAEAFAAERIQAQLATSPVGEAHATALPRTAYHQAREPVPQHIRWVDGPLELVETLLRMRPQMSAWGEDQWKSSKPDLRWPGESEARWGVHELVREGLEHARREKFARTGWWGGHEEENWQIQQHEQIRTWLERLEAVVSTPVREQVEWRVGQWMQARVEAEVRERGLSWEVGRLSSGELGVASVQAYVSAPEFTVARFFAQFAQSRETLSLADLNQLVSGYWLARDLAILVHRPTRLERDQQGQLHGASGPAIAYADGWSCYAWHGVPVPEHVILHPEQLTREDFLGESNVEVRRVIQERMGERFVQELGGQVIDRGPRGTLYEVQLPPDDPERVARYVEVQDASTPRQYFLRVPPRIRTAAEAVAWTFDLSQKAYHPLKET